MENNNALCNIYPLYAFNNVVEVPAYPLNGSVE